MTFSEYVETWLPVLGAGISVGMAVTFITHVAGIPMRFITHAARSLD